jgi:hypothetical protein
LGVQVMLAKKVVGVFVRFRAPLQLDYLEASYFI